jgi:hypothetical protein
MTWTAALRGWEKTALEMVERNPSQAILVALGVGFGLGLLVADALGRRRAASEGSLSESIREISEKIAEQLARHGPRSGSRS